MSAILDTHAVVWYLENSPELSVVARKAIEDEVRAAGELYLSAISLVEIVYLVEKGRLTLTAMERLQAALRDPRSGFFVAPLDESVVAMLPKILRDDVPDMPDRIIAATALHLGFPLITRDRRLQSAGLKTIW